jgi:hypothetical protein
MVFSDLVDDSCRDVYRIIVGMCLFLDGKTGKMFNVKSALQDHEGSCIPASWTRAHGGGEKHE